MAKYKLEYLWLDGYEPVRNLRSKTQLSKEVLTQASDLLAIGCFCIGTNQVDLVQANAQGAPVFNAPLSNTRSVAELMIAEIIVTSGMVRSWRMARRPPLQS